MKFVIANINLIVALMFFLCATQSGGAPPKISASNFKNIPKWFSPTFYKSEKPGYIRILLTGKAKPSSSVSFQLAEVIRVDSESELLKIGSAANIEFQSRQAVADDSGYFSLSIEALPGHYILPARIETPLEGDAHSYLINLNVPKLNSIDTDQARKYERERQSFLNITREISFGAGASLLKDDQINPDIGTNLRVQTMGAPSLFYMLTFRLNSLSSIKLMHSRILGQLRYSEPIVFDSTIVDWETYTLELWYVKDKWSGRFLSRNWNIGLIWGVQHHSIPFMARKGGSNPNEFKIEDNTYTTLLAGLFHLWELEEKWSLESSIKYQYPLFAGSLFAIKKSTILNGSAGLTYKSSKKWKFGGYWRTQMHKMTYHGHVDQYFEDNPSSGKPSTSGSKDLLSFVIELRAMFAF
jgi:hypothetical protein